MNAAAEAIREGDLAALKRALAEDPKLACKPQLVVDAAGAANVKLLEFLLARGADLDAQWRGYRPLHVVIQSEPHAKDEEPSKARAACLDWLLEHGADPEQLGAWPPARAVLIAAFTGLPKFVERLIEAGARVDGFVACALGDAKTVDKTLAREPGFAKARDLGGLTALQCCAASRLGVRDAAVRKRLLAIAAKLLDAGADPNAHTKSWSNEVDVAYFAASADKREMFELLLTRGADATAALPSAVWSAHAELGEIALRHGAEIDRAQHDGKPLLNDLIRWGQLQPALWLLEHGASPNIADDRGWTAVHQAASRGNARMLAAVLAAGGDRERRSSLTLTPLQVAQLARKKVSIEILAR
jgi:ankyrin repeat protein